MLQEFKAFIAKGNVMDMAVGIIVGAAFTAIVSSLVGDLINPIIGLFTGGIDFTDHYVVLAGEVPADASLEAAREAGASIFAYGSFVMAVVNFLIIAFVVFMPHRAREHIGHGLETAVWVIGKASDVVGALSRLELVEKQERGPDGAANAHTRALERFLRADDLGDIAILHRSLL